MSEMRTRAGMAGFDPIAMEVFSNRLLSITEDMGNSLIRSSFSTNIKERRDCSVGLFDHRGRCIAQASHMPMHLGSLMGSTLAVLQRYKIEDIREGDAFICNDVYLANGTHQPDVSVVSPIYWQGKLRFFAANVGHHSDVGGTVPGSIAGGSRTIFEEGIRIPVIRICRAGELDADLMRLLVHNTREPEDRELDFRVQIATNERGAAMMQAMIGQLGMESVERSVEDLLSYTNRRIRNRIAELKDGEYTGTAEMDDDGLGGGETVAIHAAVRVQGERLVIDLAGSHRQGRGAMNLPESALKATVYYVVKVALDPDMPPNSGFFDAIEVHAPEGTIVNPKFPGAVGARSITANKVASAILSAFTGLIPRKRVMAPSHDAVPAMVFSGQHLNGHGTYVYLETMGGGNGARHDRDGMEGIQVHISNTSNLPAEALEYEYALMVDEYALVQDSGGAGTYRGGMGLARQIHATEDGVIFSARAENHIVSPPGVFGGGSGRNARLVKNAGTPDALELDSKVAHLALRAGESIRLETAGGGGFGPPRQRSPALIAADLRGGKISRGAAERDYGSELVLKALAHRPLGKAEE